MALGDTTGVEPKKARRWVLHYRHPVMDRQRYLPFGVLLLELHDTWIPLFIPATGIERAK
jgi:hypothetical protein